MRDGKGQTLIATLDPRPAKANASEKPAVCVQPFLTLRPARLRKAVASVAVAIPIPVPFAIPIPIAFPVPIVIPIPVIVLALWIVPGILRGMIYP